MSHPDFENKYPGMTFKALVENWKPIHYLKLEMGTSQTYDRRLPMLEFLNDYKVEDISISTIDELINHWIKNCIKSKRRYTFTKELNILKVILRWYHTRISYRYIMPVLREHYSYANVGKRPKAPVQSLSRAELHPFLGELKRERNHNIYAVALAQFALSLRIGETLGLHWEAVDLKNGIATIDWTVTGDLKTWEPRIKHKPKNGQIRILRVQQVLVDELKRLEAYRDPKISLVFNYRGHPLNRQSLAKTYNRVLKRLGITCVHGTHFIRKSAATLANEITGDFFAVANQLGHADVQVTRKYCGHKNTAALKVAEALNSVLQTPPQPISA